MEIRAAFFDLDGTLLDSMGMWSDIDDRFLGKRGIPVPADYQKAVAVMRIHEAARYTVERFGLPDSPQMVEREWLDMAHYEYASNIQMKPGALEYLKALRAQGVRLGVLTSITRDLFEPVLKRCGAYDLFDAFTSATEAPRGKAYPDAYLIAADRLNTDPHACVMYDDMADALLGARAAGMTTVGVYDPHAGVGREELAKAADWCIDGFDEELRAWRGRREAT